MLDLNDITTFVQVVRSGSFAEAARRKSIPANTLSRRIQKLEVQLGTRLMQRSTRRLSLTSAGQMFYDRCADFIDGLLVASNDLFVGSRQPTGLVRVAVAADFFDFFPISMVTSFLDAHPQVRLAFLLSDAVVDLVAEQIDVAFRGGQLTDSSYIGRQLMLQDDTLLASPAYLASRGQPAVLADLANHDCVTGTTQGGSATWRLHGPDGGEVEIQVSGRFEANTAQAQRKATLAGLGIGMLPPSLATQDVLDGRLVRVLSEYKLPRGGLAVLYPSRRQLPAAVAAFIEVVVERVNAGLAAGKDPAWSPP